MSNWKAREYAQEIFFTLSVGTLLVYLASVIPA
jgi:hypothetical protein